MPKSKNRRRRSPSQTASPGGQTMMENLAVEPQANKPVPSPRVIDVDAGPEKPLVEITASPVTREPIVRIGARRKQSSAIAPAAASAQTGNGGTTSRKEKSDDAAADPKPASTAIAADRPEAAPMEPEALDTQAEEVAAKADTSSDTIVSTNFPTRLRYR